MRFALPLATALLLAPLSAIQAAELPRSKAAADAAVYFISPKEGEVIKGAVTVRMGLRGMGVAPAGIDKDNTGHHHLLINLDTLPDMGQPLPATDQIRHFGGGQTETVLQLPKGKHTLQLLLGDKLHIPHATPVVSEKITITVE